MRALVVEDEKRLAQNVADGLRQCAGYAVDVADDGESGLFMAENNEYDLVVLDLMLPKFTGAVLLARYRQSGHEAPVLILTARDDKQSIIRLLDAGALPNHPGFAGNLLYSGFNDPSFAVRHHLAVAVFRTPEVHHAHIVAYQRTWIDGERRLLRG